MKVIEEKQGILEQVVKSVPPGLPPYPMSLIELTTDGWEVVERFEIDEPITFMEHVEQPGPHNQYNPYPMPLQTRIGKQSYFRLRKGGETVVSRLNREIINLKTENNKIQTCADEQRRKIEELTKNLEAANNQLRISRDQYNTIRTQREQIEQTKRQLELDIGKVREHIGRKAMDEILGRNA